MSDVAVSSGGGLVAASLASEKEIWLVKVERDDGGNISGVGHVATLEAAATHLRFLAPDLLLSVSVDARVSVWKTCPRDSKCLAEAPPLFSNCALTSIEVRRLGEGLFLLALGNTNGDVCMASVEERGDSMRVQRFGMVNARRTFQSAIEKETIEDQEHQKPQRIARRGKSKPSIPDSVTTPLEGGVDVSCEILDLVPFSGHSFPVSTLDRGPTPKVLIATNSGLATLDVRSKELGQVLLFKVWSTYIQH